MHLTLLIIVVRQGGRINNKFKELKKSGVIGGGSKTDLDSKITGI